MSVRVRARLRMHNMHVCMCVYVHTYSAAETIVLADTTTFVTRILLTSAEHNCTDSQKQTQRLLSVQRCNTSCRQRYKILPSDIIIDLKRLHESQSSL